MTFYKNDNITPLCELPEGCPVEDLATDEELSNQIDQFLTAKALYGVTEDAKTQQSTFEALGLYDDPKAHLQMEIIYAQWRQLKK